MKKLLAIFCLLLTCGNLSWATFGAATAWNVVASTGSDTHGGAFDSGVGSPGTDESLGSGTAITVTLTGTTTGTGSPAFSSTTHGPGNFVYIASGSGCTTGWFEVLSQSVGVATFDHSMGSATNVCTGTIGGALADVNTAIGEIVAGNTVWCNGTTTITSSITVAVNASILGFTSTHGDATNTPPCTITTSTNSVTDILVNGVGLNMSNVAVTSTAGSPANGIEARTSHSAALSMTYGKVSGFVKCIDGDDAGSTETFVGLSLTANEITGCSTFGLKNTGGNAGDYTVLAYNTFHDISGTGGCVFINTSSLTAIGNLFINCNGGSASAINSSGPTTAISNTFFGTAGYALTLSSGYVATVHNNVFYGNGEGISFTPATGTTYSVNTNAFGDNTSGNGFTGVNPITLSTNPFVASGSGNFALNNTAGGGAALIGTGAPGQFPIGYTTTGYPTIGAVQPQTSSGSGSLGDTTVQ